MGARHARITPPKEREDIQYNYSIDPLRVRLGKKGDLCCPNGAAVSGEFVFIAEGGIGGIARVSVFSMSGELVTRFSNEYMVCPWSIAVHRDSIYLTDIDTNNLFYFGEDEGFSVSRRIGGRGVGETEFNSPNQVSVSRSGEVYVADQFNDRIQILDGSLKYLRSITHPSLSAPIGVRAMREGVYVLSSSGSYTLHSFSLTTEGRVYSSSFTMDENSNIITSDTRHAGVVKVFSKEGVLLHEMRGWSGERGEEGEEVRTVLAQGNRAGILAVNKYGMQTISRSEI